MIGGPISQTSPNQIATTSRRRFLRQLAIGGGVARMLGTKLAFADDGPTSARRDVPWLGQVQTPPQAPPNDAPTLRSILELPDGNVISTLEAWRQERPRIAATWQEYLGSLGTRPDRPPRVTRVVQDRVDGVSRQLIRYEVEPGELTEAYLLRPEMHQKRRSAVLVLHSTVDGSIRQPSGVAAKEPAEKAFGLELARRGFVALCPRNFLWPTTDKIDTAQAMRRHAERHPRATGMAKMLHDAQVSLDLLAAQDDVDRDRLAVVGHSLGAKEALYLAAFDERVRCAVSSEGGVGLPFSNWDAPWYLGPEMRRGLAGHEHHELLALVAPRAFLLVGGGTPQEIAGANGADGDRSWPFVAEALKVYRLYDGRPKLGLYNHRQGHSVPKVAADRIYEWVETYC